MDVQTSINGKNYLNYTDEDNHQNHINEYDEEIDETEDDLIENYLYLTKRCHVLRHSPTTSALDTLQHHHHHHQQQHTHQPHLPRQFTWANEDDFNDHERNLPSSKPRLSINYSIIDRIPPTIYYNETNDDDNDKSFSLVKLFARMKARLKHDRRYRPKTTHELLREDDSPEWYELTKNIRPVLTKALLPDGGYDALLQKSKNQYLQKKSRDSQPVLMKDDDDDDDKIDFHLDDEFNTENDPEFDEVIWKKFLNCSRGFSYRRNAVCKAVDRQQYQGQLVYVYGVANNILIDENLKASGLG